MMGFVRLGMAGLVSALVSVFHTGTALPMVSIMAACAVGALLFLGIKTPTRGLSPENQRDAEKEMAR